jgi:pyruvate dehydrogenase E2 component (dihydrolipoamide acetyltransferase)
MDQASFTGWLKKEGEKVAAGDPLLTIEGDKATTEIESMDAGILRLVATSPKVGDIVTVGQLLGYLAAEGEQLPGGPTAPIAAASEKIAAVPATSENPVAPAKPAPPVSAGNAPRVVPTTPRARRASLELGVDLAQLTGSGKGGRIRERDVRSSTSVQRTEVENAELANLSDIPVSIMRRTIADRMMQSLATTAPVTLTCRVDATNLVLLRNHFKASKADTIVPAYSDIIAKLAAIAITRSPAITSQWKGDRIIVPSQINIGFAVDTEYGLIVPVIRDVPQLSLAELATRSRALIESAYARRLKPAELQGGVFTLTNLGTFGIDAFTPIINCPESAILGLGAIRSEPAVIDGKVVVRDQITLSLTFDHRVLDGAPAARFLQSLAQGIENPFLWLLDAAR